MRDNKIGKPFFGRSLAVSAFPFAVSGARNQRRIPMNRCTITGTTFGLLLIAGSLGARAEDVIEIDAG